MQRSFAPAAALLAATAAMVTSCGISAAQGGIPSEQDVLDAQAFVAVYKSPFGGAAVVRRKGRELPVYPGMLLFDDDVVEIVSGQPDLVIDPFRGNSRIVLSPQRNVHRVKRESTMAPTFAPPLWVRRLFASTALIQSSPTIARGEGEDERPDVPAAACDGPARRLAAVQAIGRQRTHITILWGRLPVRRIALLRADGSSLRVLPAVGTDGDVRLEPTDANGLATIGLEDRAGKRLREIAVRFVAEDATGSPEARLADAIASLAGHCVGRDARGLEAVSTIAELRTSSPVAAVVYRAIARGAIRW
jgi:hypothetical protein